MGPLAGRVLLLSLLVGLSVNLTEDCDEFAPLRGEAVELGGAPGGGLGALGQCLDVALLLPGGVHSEGCVPAGGRVGEACGRVWRWSLGFSLCVVCGWVVCV